MNQEDFVLHKYGTPEMDFAIWDELVRYRLGSLSEEEIVSLFQRLTNSGKIVGFKGEYAQEWWRLWRAGKLKIPAHWN